MVLPHNAYYARTFHNNKVRTTLFLLQEFLCFLQSAKTELFTIVFHVINSVPFSDKVGPERSLGFSFLSPIAFFSSPGGRLSLVIGWMQRIFAGNFEPPVIAILGF